MATDNRSTSYAIVVYPESVDVGMLKMFLQARHICAALSPLHDLDTYNEIDVMDWDKRVADGELDPERYPRPVVGAPKKPHHHLVLSFGRQKKSYQQIRDIMSEFGYLVPWVEPVRNLDGYVRYLCHLDDDDKPHYDVRDVWTSAGFDLSPLWSVSKADKRGCLGTLCDYVRDYHIFNFSELVDVVHQLDSPALWDCVREASFMLSKYMEGRQLLATGALHPSCVPSEVVKAIRMGMDPATGEVPEEVREVA